jgi:hypothetical protein
MMAVIRPDTLSCSAATKEISVWLFKLDVERDEESREAGSWLTDEDTVTSITSTDRMSLASADTVCNSWRTWDPILLEDHEIGPPPRLNPGPPFAVGEVIMCDIPGHPNGAHYILGHPRRFPNRLRRGFVLQSEHPRYQIHLKNGQTVWTHMGELWFCPPFALGEFAEDQDDPFANLRIDTLLEFGSCSVHVNAQQEALERVVNVKAFAKAVIADDAEVLVYIWNERMWAPRVTIAKQDAVLTVFWKLSRSLLLRGLVPDRATYLRRVHGANWLTA